MIQLLCNTAYVDSLGALSTENIPVFLMSWTPYLKQVKSV